MNYRLILNILGKILLVIAALLLPSLLLAIVLKEYFVIWAFLIPMLLMTILGLVLIKIPIKHQHLFAKDGLVIVSLGWIFTSFFGALPFYISRAIPSLLDAVFESVSGFTTTGASILTNVENLPASILFWRSFTHWIGGMGVLVFLLAILPKTNLSMIHLLKAESPGPVVGKLVSKIRLSARILYGIYVLLTLSLIFFLLIGKMPFFDSVVNAFSTAGTGGFAIKNSSIAYYNSAYIEVVIGFFMILFGVNFNIYYLLLLGSFKKVLKNPELKWYLGIIFVSTALIAFNIRGMFVSNQEALRASFFQVSSIITTTGFASTDFDLWPLLAKTVLFFLMIIGASAGSTGGGFKVSRLLILFKSVKNSIRSMLNPRRINSISLGEEIVDSKTEKSVLTYFAAYMIIALLSIFILSFGKTDIISNITSVFSCLNNVGPGFGISGPSGNYSSFSGISKLVLMINMLVGRLEIYPMIAIFSIFNPRR